MISSTTNAQAKNAIKVYEPINEKAFAGKPKMPAPMTALTVKATRSHLRMPRTRPSDEVVGGAIVIYPISIRDKQFGVRRQSAAATALWMRGVPNRFKA